MDNRGNLAIHIKGSSYECCSNSYEYPIAESSKGQLMIRDHLHHMNSDFHLDTQYSCEYRLEGQK